MKVSEGKDIYCISFASPLWEKQKEVLDSIRYAKRIQTAHLPTEKFITRSLERLIKYKC